VIINGVTVKQDFSKCSRDVFPVDYINRARRLPFDSPVFRPELDWWIDQPL